MLSKNDLIVVGAGLAGIVVGLLLPWLGLAFAPYLAYGMMLLLLFSFLKIALDDIWQSLKNQPLRLILLAGIKLVAMPLAAYYITMVLDPTYALAMLLLAGVSTGVTAPFFVGVVGGNMALALVMAVSTSFILPVSLPLIVKVAAGQAIDFDLLNMALFLAVVIFAPLILALLIRRFTPKLGRAMIGKSFPVSVFLIFIINVGIFGKYAGYILSRPDELVLALVMSCCLALAGIFIGALVLFTSPSADQAGAAGSLFLINNVLIVVLGIHLDDAATSITAGLYMLPTFLLIMALAWIAKRDRR